MAKRAADSAVEFYQKQVLWWQPQKTPAIVSISLLTDLIKKKYNNIKQKQWDERKRKIKQKRINRDIYGMRYIYINDNLFLKAMFKRDNVNILNQNGKHFFAEVRRLKARESEIITKLE